jgi:hypothetical protein
MIVETLPFRYSLHANRDSFEPSEVTNAARTNSAAK